MHISHNYTYIPSLLSLPLLPSSHPARSSWRMGLGSLCYVATSHQLSVLHMIVYIYQCYFLHLFHSLLSSLCPQVSSLYLHLQSFPANRFINIIFIDFTSSVQSLSRVHLSATPQTAPCQASLSITISQSLLKLTSIESVMPSNHLILCSPFLLLLSILPSIKVFSNESTLRMRWPKYWSFSFNISPSNEYLGLIFFRMDWLDILAVQGTLKSLLQHHGSKA